MEGTRIEPRKEKPKRQASHQENPPDNPGNMEDVELEQFLDRTTGRPNVEQLREAVRRKLGTQHKG